MSDEKSKLTWYVCSVGNVKFGTSKNGNPWIRLGFVVKTGPKKGTWMNQMLFVTEKTKQRTKETLALCGVTLGDGEEYTLDRRMVSVGWGYSDFWKEETVCVVRPSKFQPDTTKVEKDLAEEDF